MAREWLSFWNQETRARQRRTGTGRARPSAAQIYIPYGQGQVAVGDTVYCVAVDAGELLLFCRVGVEDLHVDSEHAESLDVYGELTPSPFNLDGRVVDQAAVDRLVYLKADGGEHELPRNASGVLVGNAFQGRASIRELVGGMERLD